MDQDSLDFDVVILGSGPAGLQAAVHAARTKASVAVLGRMHKSSLFRAHVENYCCMDTTMKGQDILEQGRAQAAKFGARFFDRDVLGIDQDSDGRFLVSLESGEKLRGWTMILCMGIARNRLNVPGEKEFLGKGVSYCVDCDANFYRNQPVSVVGDESAACAGSLNLLLIASDVHLIFHTLSADEHLMYQIERSAIHKHAGRKIKAIEGEGFVQSVLMDNGERIEVTGVFIELGAKGALELAAKLGVDLDPENMCYIKVNRKQETSIPGVYAAGDICGPPWQMAKAVGEGCVAGLEAAAFAKRAKTKAA